MSRDRSNLITISFPSIIYSNFQQSALSLNYKTSDADWTALDRSGLRSNPRTAKYQTTLQKPVLDRSINPGPPMDSPDYLYYFCGGPEFS